MELYINPARSEWPALCSRPSDDNAEIRLRVAQIIKEVREGGDSAIARLTREIDGSTPEKTEVDAAAISAAAERVPAEVKEAIKLAAANIRAFHAAQRTAPVEMETMPGVRCIQKAVPIEKVGLYVPGGTAPLFSTVLMLAIPAKVAGCRQIILCSPAGRDGEIAPAVLYAASVCGVDRIFRIGGAQAIAAMACGTESVPKVDKIFGPGNRYVTTAKQILGGSIVSIDMPAGPSEVMVLADTGTSPEAAAADLLSQAEHGVDSQVMLVCTEERTVAEVREELGRQTAALPRADFVRQALDKSRCIVLSDEQDRIDFANAYAPEHLILALRDPWTFADKVTAAGSVFVGAWTPESAGDYASGTNHTLPTCAWARSFSGVNLDSFYRKMTLQELSREGLLALSETIVTMAEAEGLQAHANAVKIRLGNE
jgi:histidinol dehydrogenase